MNGEWWSCLAGRGYMLFVVLHISDLLHVHSQSCGQNPPSSYQVRWWLLSHMLPGSQSSKTPHKPPLTHTHTHTLLFICLSKSTDCLYRHTFIHRSKVLISIWLKAFELLSTQLNFFTSFLSQLWLFFFSLFLQQWAGLVRSGSSTISLRCTLPSCCFAMIKELLDKWLGWTGSP